MASGASLSVDGLSKSFGAAQKALSGVKLELKPGEMVALIGASYHTLIARVAEGSAESLYLNERAGFVHVGTLKEVGRKFGRFLDVHMLQKMLD